MTVQPTRDQLEAELDSWMARAYEAEKRAWRAEARIAEEKHLRMKATAAATKAEARIKAVQDALDTYAYTGIYTGQERVAVSDIRRALEG